MKKSRVIRSVTAVFAIAIFSISIYTLIAKITDTSAIQIDKVEVLNGQSLHVKGDFTDSAKKYAGNILI
ncbi:hypothetical protein ACQKMD_09840 [Viridibacillus sp. NPDC096237]|uniref:hypothetical protein n=1 Tax=Viridibacillus sp. NPDC096237 TaxID=3390721 RepID=UPI003D077A5C